MPELVRSIDIDASPELVWAAVTDWDQHDRWMLLTTLGRVGREGTGVGARIEAVTGVGPMALRDPMTVTVWRPPYRCETRHDGRWLRGTGAFDVEPLPGGRSRFTWSEWVEPPFGRLGEVGFALARPLLGGFLAVCLRRLSRWAPAR